MSVKETKNIVSIMEQYDKEFDSNWFLNSYYNEIHPAEENCLKKLNDVFTRGILKGSIKRCIDIGCGPIVHRLSAPSKICDTLVYSDFSSNNTEMVRDWLEGPGNDSRHANFFKLCAKLEGFSDLKKGANEIENRIKSKVKDVKSINVLKSNPLGQLEELFDVAFTAACVEAACESYESYVEAIKNIGTILRPGGYLIIKGYVGATYYVVNRVTFPVLYLTMDMVKKALQEGGFSILEIEKIDDDARENVINGKQCGECMGSVFGVAQKL